MRKVLILAVLPLLLAGCDKDEDLTPDITAEEVTTVVDHVFIERAVLPMFPLARALRAGPGEWAAIVSHTCAAVDSITGDTTNFPSGGPVTVYLDFPDPGCVDIDGHRRAGSLIITLTDTVNATSSVVTIVANDLTDNGLRYRFVDSFAVNVDSSFFFYGGDWGRRVHGATRYYAIEGQGDGDHANDAFSITHTLSGIDRDGVTYQSTTTTALQLHIDCPWVTAGTESIQPNGLDERILEYGSGTCEPHVDIIVGEFSVGLTIP
jgi:hypothetical protein